MVDKQRAFAKLLQQGGLNLGGVSSPGDRSQEVASGMVVYGSRGGRVTVDVATVSA
jgi:hypothetical protein